MGAAIVGIVLYDVFQGVVVPRWTSRAARIAPLLVEHLWTLWRVIAFRFGTPRRREDFLATYAPFALMMILLCWVASLVFGYGLILHALRGQIPKLETFGDAFYLAGVGLLTIGFGDIVATGGPARVVLLSAGASGLAIFALVLSLTFSLYGLFTRREVLVLTLDARAGSPPSGLALLETYAQLEMLDELPRFFDAWELWAAEMLDSHLAYPLLPYFRSSHDDLSWVSSLGAVLDAATLLLTTIESGPQCGGRPIGAAHLMYKLGCHAVDDLSHFQFNTGLYHGQKDAGRNAGVERSEFVQARERLQHAGFCLRDEDRAWEEFAQHRAVYAHALNNLAKHFTTPPAQWIGDRSTLSFARPQS